ncbi:MAG: CvpA family protein [Eubacterium sp.]|nr:CvpA family protein [Eubacterium sp.]
MNWLVIFTIVCFLLFGFIGYKRGLIKSLLGTGATIIALVLSYALAPAVSKWMQDHTSLDDKIDEKIYSMIEKKVDETLAGTRETAKEIMNKNPGKQEQVSFIQELRIPDFLEKMLLDNNNDEGYKETGATTVYHYISRTLTTAAMNIIAGLITFIVLRLIFMVGIILLGKVIHAIPIVGVLDKAGGAVAGAALAVIVVWAVMFVLSLVMKDRAYNDLLKDNAALAWLDQKNVIMKLTVR